MIEIRTVSTRRDLDLFIDTARIVQGKDPNWIAPLPFERREVLSQAKNPYFQHAEGVLMLALRDGRPVGRISAQVDRLHRERYRDGAGHFGFLEAIDDPEVFRALFDAAETWLRTRGSTVVRGPFNFSINEEIGLLVDGFDEPPRVLMGHNPPYYGPHLEALGYARAKDVIAYDYDGRTPLPRSMASLLEKIHKSGDVKVRPINKKRLFEELDVIIDIFNDAWSDNWGFVPMTPAEIRHMGEQLRFLVAEGYIAIVEYQGKNAAMAVSLPDVNDWLRGLNGRLLPFGWLKLAKKALSAPEAIRMPLMGVRKAYQSTAIGSALALAAIDAVRQYHLARGTHRAELSWILEDNLPMRKMIEALGGKPYKTYRIYERAL
jgi:GNAT superfamily N-acetyltransferase